MTHIRLLRDISAYYGTNLPPTTHISLLRDKSDLLLHIFVSCGTFMPFTALLCLLWHISPPMACIRLLGTYPPSMAHICHLRRILASSQHILAFHDTRLPLTSHIWLPRHIVAFMTHVPPSRYKLNETSIGLILAKHDSEVVCIPKCPKMVRNNKNLLLWRIYIFSR